jgi:hypothetical protein
VLVLELLCDGVPVGTRTSPTSRGLVQEHKVGPIPRGEVSGEVRTSINLFLRLGASANIRRTNRQEEVERGKEGRKNWEER